MTLWQIVREIFGKSAISFVENCMNVTLGARDFSSAVSGFCQVFIVTPDTDAFTGAFHPNMA